MHIYAYTWHIKRLLASINRLNDAIDLLNEDGNRSLGLNQPGLAAKSTNQRTVCGNAITMINMAN
jgi:hypothetical protein